MSPVRNVISYEVQQPQKPTQLQEITLVVASTCEIKYEASFWVGCPILEHNLGMFSLSSNPRERGAL